MSLTSRSYGAASMCGGSGGYGTRISSYNKGSFSSSSYGYGALPSTHGLDLHVSANEKTTLQTLNDRLGNYMEKVRTLEKENGSLEKQIREWYEKRTVVCHDYNSYFATMNDLNNKICFASKRNQKIFLDIDNSKLAADDFKMKYDNEQAMRLAVEADISGLRRVLDDLNLSRSDLEMHYEGLKEELIMLKKNHEEELLAMRTHMTGQVNVEVDAKPSVDLGKILMEIREHYESITEKNRRDLETWYQSKITIVEKEVLINTTELTMYRTEVKELKSTFQRLQIELQSLMSMKASLEGTLHETQARYAAQLTMLQGQVTSLEAQMSQLLATIASNKLEYDMLLDLKTRLELEIAEYRRLLDGEDTSHTKVVTKTITVVQTVVDGKVVESIHSTDVNE